MTEPRKVVIIVSKVARWNGKIYGDWWTWRIKAFGRWLDCGCCYGDDKDTAVRTALKAAKLAEADGYDVEVRG